MIRYPLVVRHFFHNHIPPIPKVPKKYRPNMPVVEARPMVRLEVGVTVVGEG
jgi:hypothetical protein